MLVLPTYASTSVGEPVSSDCIPYSAIPHTTKLFSDFLFDHGKVRRFFVRPMGTEWLAEEARLVKYDDRQRAQVADILERQNRAWGASTATLENLNRFRQGAVAIVTGQQVGLFGGPLYSLLKAASVLRTARDLTKRGIGAVPIFWLATEDHDLLEVNHAVLPASAGQLRTLVSASRGKASAPVGTVQFSDEIEQVARNAAELLGDSEVADHLIDSYRAGETYGSAFARLFTKIFGDHGLVLLDPLDAQLHQLAVPILRAAAENAVEIDKALLARGKELRDAGYHEQVKVTPESTLLFSIANGERKVIHVANGGFMIGAEKISCDELLRRIDERPEDFSPNVLLRPVVQDYLLPTVTYFGGAAELAYFAQVAVVYERLLGRVTPIQPRFGATLVDKRMQRLLARYKLNLPDLFRGSENLRERLASQVLPEKLHDDFEEAHAAVESAMKNIRASLQQLDTTLIDASERAGRKMKYQLTRLHGRAARAELRRNSQLSRDADELLAGLFPHKMLQEREIPGIYFLAREGRGLIDRLVDAAGECCPSHQLLYL